MSDVLVVLQLAIELAFAALALKTVLTFAQDRSRRRGYLALALGALALEFLILPLMSRSQAATDVALVLFLLSGFGLVMFRDTFVPYGEKLRAALITIIAVTAVLGLAVGLPADPAAAHSPIQTFAVVAVIGVWTYCLLEPAVTFWLSARDRPAVERARMHFISVGFAGLMAVVVIGTLAGAFNTAVTVLIDLAALAMVPVLYVAFFPPTWIRRLWRQPEEDEFRHALHELLLYSPDRATLAHRALAWAERLVGGEAAFVVDSDGSILATRDIAPDAAQKLVATSDSVNSVEHGAAPWRDGPRIVAPLDLHEGRGAMVIIAGRLSPLFGDDELSRLRQYSASITAGLDRVSLNERIAALERAKSDFLSIASHELRGPMTVIKGYLTMLESGALGEVSPKVQSVMPLLISKSDEVNWMIEQMIEASRLEEGKLALKKRKTDIVELTEIAIDGVKMLLGNHNLKVDVPHDAIDADVDPDRFQIVIRNLLSNAAKYSAGGTDIAVTVRRNGSTAAVAVRDHGVGISQGDQAVLFSRFSRIESSTHVQGTGLGLWLSQEIARMHDGEITVQSTPGEGSTFTFTVPIAA